MPERSRNTRSVSGRARVSDAPAVPAARARTLCRILCALLWLLPGAVAAGDARAPFRVGVVPQYEASELHLAWSALLAQLGARVDAEFQLVGSPSIPDFEQSLANGEFDFAYLNPYDAVVAHAVAGYESLVRDLSANLHGVLVVRRDSDIRSVAELAGREVAFPAPNALGASLLMRAELETIFDVRVEPRYVKTHDSVYLNVVLGEVVAGGGVLRTLDRQPPAVRRALRILFTTTAVPSHPVSVHPRVDARWRGRVLTALRAMADDPESRKLLHAVSLRDPGPTDFEDFAFLQSMGLERYYVKPE